MGVREDQEVSTLSSPFGRLRPELAEGFMVMRPAQEAGFRAHNCRRNARWSALRAQGGEVSTLLMPQKEVCRGAQTEIGSLYI